MDALLKPLKPKTPRRRFFETKVERRPIAKRLPEWRAQAEIISTFHKLEAAGWPFTCAGDMNAGRRTASEQGTAKVTGMTAGEPDVRIYLPNGRLGLMEVKIKGNKLTKDQEKRHARLKALGHTVVTLTVSTIEEARDGAVKLLKAMLGMK